MGFVGGLGHLSEAGTGLIYMKARYYDPTLGRFNSEDSAGHGSNWFVYCSDNPINRIDADGKQSYLLESIAALVGLLGAAVWCAEASPVFAAVYKAWAVSMGFETLWFIAARVGAGMSGKEAEGFAIAVSTMALAATWGCGMVASAGGANMGSVGAFYAGYSALLSATMILLDMEVTYST